MLLQEEVQLIHRKLDILLSSTMNPNQQDEAFPQVEAANGEIHVNTFRIMNGT